jgi:RimJ/RimL family protein N-acetyltransferase
MKVRAMIGQNELVAQWVANHKPFNPQLGFGNCTAIGWCIDDNLIAGTVYHNYDRVSGVIELSSASDDPRWLTRDTIRLMFSYPFDQLNCQMVVLRVAESNTRMRKIAKKFGFTEYLIPRLRGRSEAECVQTYTVEQWLQSPFAQPMRKAA